MGETPSAVLFACTMNAVRSAMAESILKHFHGHRIYVDSVGVSVSNEVNTFAVTVMDEIGIDLSQHKPKLFDNLEDNSYDLVITLSPQAQHKAVEMTRNMACEVKFWNTLDATMIGGNREAQLAAYRQVRDELLRRIKKLFPLTGAVDI